MKQISNFTVINNPIKIRISQKCLFSIQEIVSIAPQEAQWFNTVTPVTNSNGRLEYLDIGDKLYIPEQICSATEVDTDPQMMISFYRDLIKDHSVEETNEILQSMTCWSHSHVNMGCSPSGQDVSQFTNFIKMDLDQNNLRWQVMLIFNKKDEYYSRVFDPNTGLIYTGVPLEVYHDYDLSYILEASKTKFKKKPLPDLKAFPSYSNTNILNSKTYTSSDYDFPVNDHIAENLISNIFGPSKKKVKTTPTKAEDYVSTLYANLSDQELVWLNLILTKNISSLKKTQFFDESKCEDYYFNTSNKRSIDDFFFNFFTTTTLSVDEFKEALTKVFELTDQITYTDYLKTVNRFL